MVVRVMVYMCNSATCTEGRNGNMNFISFDTVEECPYCGSNVFRWLMPPDKAEQYEQRNERYNQKMILAECREEARKQKIRDKNRRKRRRNNG